MCHRLYHAAKPLQHIIIHHTFLAICHLLYDEVVRRPMHLGHHSIRLVRIELTTAANKVECASHDIVDAEKETVICSCATSTSIS